MKAWKVLACAVCLLLLCIPTVQADSAEDLYREQWDAVGGDDLLDSLPAETRALLQKLGITSFDLTLETTPDTWLQVLWDMAKTVAAQPLSACGTVVGIVLVYAWVDGTRHALNAAESVSVFSSVCALSACAVIMVPLASVIQRVQEAMESTSVFMTSFIPVYAGVLITGGQPTAAVSFQSIVLYAAELFAWLANGVIVPLLSVSLALGLTGSLTPELRLSSVGASVGKLATFLLTSGMMIFTGILSIQSLTSVAADRLSDRALRFSISHFVPVVGGSISEAFATVRGCLHAVRSTMGGIGICATALIVLPPLLTCVLWSFAILLGKGAADLFGLHSFSNLMKTAHGVVRCMMGVLCVGGMLLTVSIAVLTITAGGTS